MFINVTRVVELTTLSRAQIDRLEDGNGFPYRMLVGSRVMWLEQEILDWCQARVKERDDALLNGGKYRKKVPRTPRPRSKLPPLPRPEKPA
jgi:predicted DNA-binding transcriptional regulator AlpA